MPKIKLSERDLRKVIERLLIEEPAPAPGTEAPASDTDVGGGDPLYSPINKSDLGTEANDLLELYTHAVAANDPFPLPSIVGIQTWIDAHSSLLDSGVVKQRTQIREGELDQSKTELVKEYLRYLIMTGLEGKKEDGTPTPAESAVDTYAVFFGDGSGGGDVYKRSFSATGKESEIAIFVDKNIRLIYDAAYDVTLFNSEEFYNKLCEPSFVAEFNKILSAGPGVAEGVNPAMMGMFYDKDLLDKLKKNLKAEIDATIAQAKQLYSQFDNDLVESYFCAPMAYPNIWTVVTGPEDNPLYTPWRQTWVMLNILSQAMSMRGGLESLYVKFANVIKNQKMSSASRGPQAASQEVYSGSLFNKLNESRKIMISLSELRRVIHAALMVEGALGGAGDVAGGVADVGTATARGARSFVSSAYSGTAKILKGLASGAPEARAAVNDAIKLAIKKVDKSQSLVDVLKSVDGLENAFDAAVNKIGQITDDELIPPDIWQRAGSGTDPRGAQAAQKLLITLLQQRRAAEGAAGGVTTFAAAAPQMQAIEKTAERFIMTPDVIDAKSLIKKVAEIEDGRVFVSRENIARTLESIRSNTTTTSGGPPPAALLNDAVEQVKSAIFAQISGSTSAALPIKEPGRAAAEAMQFKIASGPRPGNKVIYITAASGNSHVTPEVALSLVDTAPNSPTKTAIRAKIQAAAYAIEDKLPDGTPIDEALVTRAAEINSQGVLPSAVAIVTQPKIAQYVARRGTEEAETAGTAATAAGILGKSDVVRDTLRALSPVNPAAFAEWWSGASWTRRAGVITLQTALLPFTGVQRYTGQKAAQILSGFGLIPGTKWSNFWTGIGTSPGWSTFFGSILVAWFFGSVQKQKMGTPGETELFYQTHPKTAALIDVMASYGGFAGRVPTNFARAFISSVLSSLGPEDAQILNAYSESVLSNAAKDFYGALSAYDGMINPVPTSFKGLTSTDDMGRDDTDRRLDSASQGIRSVTEWILGSPSAVTQDVINSAETLASTFEYIESKTSVSIGGNQLFMQLEGEREEATKTVLQALAARQTSNAIQQVTVQDKRALIRPVSKNEGDFFNSIGRFIMKFVAGSSDPAKTDELLSAFTNPDFVSGEDTTIAKQFLSVTLPNPEDLPEIERKNPEAFRRLGAAIKASATANKRMRSYTKKQVQAPPPAATASQPPAAPAAP